MWFRTHTRSPTHSSVLQSGWRSWFLGRGSSRCTPRRCWHSFLRGASSDICWRDRAHTRGGVLLFLVSVGMAGLALVCHEQRKVAVVRRTGFSSRIEVVGTPTAAAKRALALQSLRRILRQRGYVISEAAMSPVAQEVAFVGSPGVPHGFPQMYLCSASERDPTVTRIYPPAGATRRGSGAGWPNTVRWSPDGRRILFFVLRDSGASILLYDVPTRTTTQLFRDAAFSGRSFENSIWLPNGDAIALTADDHQIYYGEPASGMSRLVPQLSHMALLGWSPDGRYLVCVSSPSEPHRQTGGHGLDVSVHVLDAATYTSVVSHRLRASIAGVGSNPWGPLVVWSEDGTRIALVAFSYPEPNAPCPPGHPQFLVISVTTAHVRYYDTGLDNPQDILLVGWIGDNTIEFLYPTSATKCHVMRMDIGPSG
jgi:hypothetical protein